MAAKKSATNETTDLIIKHIRSIPGAYAWRNNTTGIFDTHIGKYRPTSGKKGVSDILGALPHKLFKESPPIAQLLVVEVKTGRDKLRPEQEGFLEIMESIGAIQLVVKNYDDFKEQFKPYEAKASLNR